MKPLSGEICIFCLYHRDRKNGCTYGLHHEYPNDAPEPPPPPPKKVSPSLCVYCGLHPKNPLAATNECDHFFPATMSVDPNSNN